MLESELVRNKWTEGLLQNPNTNIYGKVQKIDLYAGSWIEPKTGKLADAVIGVDPERRKSWAR